MANHNGRTTHRDENTEHGYQDWRDQRERANGRDDFRGLDRDTSHDDRSRWMRDENPFGDRYRAGSQGTSEGGRDQWAERDRNMYGDREEGNYRGSGGGERGMMGGDYQRGSGYGYDDGNQNREHTSYRGQSGSQAGGMYGNDSFQRDQGGNRGHWGDFDRGGQSGYGGSSTSSSRDSMSPRDRTSGNDNRAMRGPHAGKGPQGFQRSDERIKEMVHEALTDHEHLDATHITVEVKQGEVTLTGTVEDRQAKRMAEDCAEQVKGVKDVLNQIRVQSSQGGNGRQSLSGSSSTNTSHMESQATQGDKKNRPS